GNAAGALAADIEPGGRAEAELLRPGLKVEAAVSALSCVEGLPQPIEPGVARLGQRLRQGKRSAYSSIEVAEDHAADAQGGGARRRRLLIYQAGCQRRLRNHRLEGRAGRIGALGGAVEQPPLSVAGKQAGEVAAVAHGGDRVPARIARQRQQRPVRWV